MNERFVKSHKDILEETLPRKDCKRFFFQLCSIYKIPAAEIIRIIFFLFMAMKNRLKEGYKTAFLSNFTEGLFYFCLKMTILRLKEKLRYE